MNDGPVNQNHMIDITDCLEAVSVFRGWKNFFFLILLVCLVLSQASFWLINVGIILAFRKGGKRRDMPYKALGKAINIAKNPWKEENEQIKELSNALDSIKKEGDEDENN